MRVWYDGQRVGQRLGGHGKLSGVVDAAQHTGRPMSVLCTVVQGTFLVSTIAAGEVCRRACTMQRPAASMQSAPSGRLRVPASCRAPPVRLVGLSVAHDGRLCHNLLIVGNCDCHAPLHAVRK